MSHKPVHLVSDSNGAYDDPDLWCGVSAGFGNYTQDFMKSDCVPCLSKCVEYGNRVAERLSELVGPLE